MVIKAEYLDTLSANDPILKKLISSYSIPTLRKTDNFLHDLIKYIIFQQISTIAGNKIYNRFLEFHSFNKPNSEFKWEEQDWKKIGLSHQKKSYIENLFDKNNLDSIQAAKIKSKLDISIDDSLIEISENYRTLLKQLIDANDQDEYVLYEPLQASVRLQKFLYY